MKFNNIEELRSHTVFSNFYDISQIPHGSFNEKELSDYLVQWAKDRGFDVEQDDYYNLIIRKEGQGNGVDKEPLLLQAHIDMVCEKDPNYDHDFEKDPIPMQVDGDELNTGGKTTLGGDNGIGVAMMMSILEDMEISHPPIEAVFTTAEEEDLSGAANLKPEWFTAKKALNLDNSDDTSLVAGSSGGSGVKLTFKKETIPKEDNLKSFHVEISGLRGGHSGGDINKGLGNAIILTNRLLERYNNELDLYVNEVKGGNFRLAIPREASMVVSIDSSDVEKFNEINRQYKEEIVTEYESFKDSLDLVVKEVEGKTEALDKDLISRLIKTIKFCPNGVFEINNTTGAVESSCNLGEVNFKEDEIELVAEIRAVEGSQVKYSLSKFEDLSKLFDSEYESFGDYPGWHYQIESELRDSVQETFKAETGKELKVTVPHVGLECGYLQQKIKGLDVVSLGPNNVGLHSPSESVNIPSVIKFYDVLLKVLENLN